MIATYKNKQTGEEYKLGGVNSLAKAWSLSKFVSKRMNWNEEMFAEDVTVSVR